MHVAQARISVMRRKTALAHGGCSPVRHSRPSSPPLLARSQTLVTVQLFHWPVGLMDKASAPGAGDSRFESWASHRVFTPARTPYPWFPPPAGSPHSRAALCGWSAQKQVGQTETQALSLSLSLSLFLSLSLSLLTSLFLLSSSLSLSLSLSSPLSSSLSSSQQKMLNMYRFIHLLRAHSIMVNNR